MIGDTSREGGVTLSWCDAKYVVIGHKTLETMVSQETYKEIPCQKEKEDPNMKFILEFDDTQAVTATEDDPYLPKCMLLEDDDVTNVELEQRLPCLATKATAYALASSVRKSAAPVDVPRQRLPIAA